MLIICSYNANTIELSQFPLRNIALQVYIIIAIVLAPLETTQLKCNVTVNVPLTRFLRFENVA